MKVKIRNIEKSILESEHLEDYTDFVHLLAEARAVNALAFFEIDYDDTRDTVEVSDAFDYDEAIEVVNLYLSYQDGDIATYSDRAKQYDDFTESSRGADDGTFDYAGTYVISILSVLKALSKR